MKPPSATFFVFFRAGHQASDAFAFGEGGSCRFSIWRELCIRNSVWRGRFCRFSIWRGIICRFSVWRGRFCRNLVWRASPNAFPADSPSPNAFPVGRASPNAFPAGDPSPNEIPTDRRSSALAIREYFFVGIGRVEPKPDPVATLGSSTVSGPIEPSLSFSCTAALESSSFAECLTCLFARASHRLRPFDTCPPGCVIASVPLTPSL